VIIVPERGPVGWSQVDHHRGGVLAGVHVGACANDEAEQPAELVGEHTVTIQRANRSTSDCERADGDRVPARHSTAGQHRTQRLSAAGRS
jgi:hypothetical protein